MTIISIHHIRFEHTIAIRTLSNRTVCMCGFGDAFELAALSDRTYSIDDDDDDKTQVTRDHLCMLYCIRRLLIDVRALCVQYVMRALKTIRISNGFEQYFITLHAPFCNFVAYKSCVV